jgi:MerR family transcriptional regulator/heat shock protein HspR
MAERDGAKGRRVRHRIETTIDEERGVFMISVAAELAEMHPQTLRMYEARGLISPKRSPKNTRLYSQRDVERLRRIQQMTTEEGLNLAGVETVLQMEERVERMRAELERMRKRTEELQRQMTEEVEKVRKSLRAEIVPYGAYDVIPAEQAPIKIPVERPAKHDRS